MKEKTGEVFSIAKDNTPVLSHKKRAADIANVRGTFLPVFRHAQTSQFSLRLVDDRHRLGVVDVRGDHAVRNIGVLDGMEGFPGNCNRYQLQYPTRRGASRKGRRPFFMRINL